MSCEKLRLAAAPQFAIMSGLEERQYEFRSASEVCPSLITLSMNFSPRAISRFCRVSVSRSNPKASTPAFAAASKKLIILKCFQSLRTERLAGFVREMSGDCER